MKLTVFSTKFSAGEVDHGTGIIRGVSVVTRGEAKGHGMFVDDKMLRQVADAINAKPNGLKTRLEHGFGAGRLMGKIRNATVDGGKVKANWHLFNSSPFKDQVIEMAQETPEDAGMSIEFKCSTEDVGGKTMARCDDLHAAALCERPAANPDGMFSEKETGEITPEELAEVKPSDREDTGLPDGSFPVATAAQAESAIKMRGRSKTHSKSEILNHVARRVGEMMKAGKISQAEHDDLMAKCDAARKADKGMMTEPGGSPETHLQAGSVDNPQKGNAEETTQSSQEILMDKAEFQTLLNEALKPITEKISALEQGQVAAPKVADFTKLLSEQMAKLSMTPPAPAPAGNKTEEKKDAPKKFEDMIAIHQSAGMSKGDAITFCVKAYPTLYKEYREKTLGFTDGNISKSATL